MNPRLYLTVPATVLAFVVAAAPATAQDAGEAVPTEATGAAGVNPVRPTYPDDAYVLEPGVLHGETGYAIAFFEDPVPTLHVWDVYAALGVVDLLEVRVGWDVLDITSEDAGLGDLTLGLKGGFFGGFDERTALAGLFAIELPTATAPVGLREGVRFEGGLVATLEVETFQFDFQATADLHLFLEDPTFLIPLAAAVTWAPVDPLRL
jgi:hypothetical protein